MTAEAGKEEHSGSVHDYSWFLFNYGYSYTNSNGANQALHIYCGSVIC